VSYPPVVTNQVVLKGIVGPYLSSETVGSTLPTVFSYYLRINDGSTSEVMFKMVDWVAGANVSPTDRVRGGRIDFELHRPDTSTGGTAASQFEKYIAFHSESFLRRQLGY